MAASVKKVLLLVFLGIFCYGVFDYVANFEKNGCEMTYMYTTPEYLVSIDSSIVVLLIFDAEITIVHISGIIAWY